MRRWRITLRFIASPAETFHPSVRVYEGHYRRPADAISGALLKDENYVYVPRSKKWPTVEASCIDLGESRRSTTGCIRVPLSALAAGEPS